MGMNPKSKESLTCLISKSFFENDWRGGMGLLTMNNRSILLLFHLIWKSSSYNASDPSHDSFIEIYIIICFLRIIIKSPKKINFLTGFDNQYDFYVHEMIRYSSQQSTNQNDINLNWTDNSTLTWYR